MFVVGFIIGLSVGILCFGFLYCYTLAHYQKGTLQHWRDDTGKIQMHVIMDEDPAVLENLNYVIFTVKHPRDSQRIL